MAVVGRASVLLAAVLLLSGCSDDEGPPPGDTTESPTAGERPSETVSESPSPSATPGQPTELALGEPATVTLTIKRRSGEAAVTVTRVRRGKIEHLSDFVLTRRERRSTPYYADVRVVNRSDTNLAGASVPLWALDSTNTVRPPVRVLGTFGRCASEPLPRKFTQGDRARTCMLFLVPKGARLAAVQYRFDDGTTGPLSWPVGN